MKTPNREKYFSHPIDPTNRVEMPKTEPGVPLTTPKLKKPKKFWHSVYRCFGCKRRVRAPFWRIPRNWTWYMVGVRLHEFPGVIIDYTKRHVCSKCKRTSIVIKNKQIKASLL